MTFVELDYLFVSFPIVVILYHVFRRPLLSTFGNTSIANVVILSASYYFYGAAVPWYLLPLIVTSLIDFVVGIKLSKVENQSYRKLLLIISLVANLGLLAFFKYTPRLIESFNGVS